jgi:branched-chain amino acid transport system ATP-binding protein
LERGSLQLLDVRNLSAGYDFDVIHDINLSVGEGELVALLGRNGAGKTTTLKAICGQTRVSSGETKLDNETITGMPLMEMAERGINLVPEGRKLFPYMSVEENLLIGAYCKRAREKKNDSLEQVHNLFPVLKRKKNQMASTLSGGEQQMLTIGRGLMSRPRVLLLDEPSVGLGPIVFENILEAVRQINAQGVAVLIVEQNVAQTLEIANRGYVLEDGFIVLEGKSGDLRQDERVKRAYLSVA